MRPGLGSFRSNSLERGSVRGTRAGRFNIDDRRAPINLRLAIPSLGFLLFLDAPALAGSKIANDLSLCDGSEPAILASVVGLKSSTGRVRVQSYHATEHDWLEKGRWLKRIDVPASGRAMRICLPFDRPGTYAVAIRHDVNGNGETDFTRDGGGMSRNPSISIFNLGRPDHDEVAVQVDGLERMTIEMRYM